MLADWKYRPCQPGRRSITFRVVVSTNGIGTSVAESYHAQYLLAWPGRGSDATRRRYESTKNGDGRTPLQALMGPEYNASASGAAPGAALREGILHEPLDPSTPPLVVHLGRKLRDLDSHRVDPGG